MDRNNCGASVSNRGWWVDKSHFYGTIKALTKRRQKIMKKRIVTLMLAAMSAEATGVPMLDDEGQETGETSAACGFILSESASALTGLVDMRIFVFANCEKTDAAKAVVNLLASME